MTGRVSSKVESSCNNWNCCKSEPKIKRNKPNAPFPTRASETEIKVTTTYQKSHKTSQSHTPSEDSPLIPNAPITARPPQFPQLDVQH